MLGPDENSLFLWPTSACKRHFLPSNLLLQDLGRYRANLCSYNFSGSNISSEALARLYMCDHESVTSSSVKPKIWFCCKAKKMKTKQIKTRTPPKPSRIYASCEDSRRKKDVVVTQST